MIYRNINDMVATRKSKSAPAEPSPNRVHPPAAIQSHPLDRLAVRILQCAITDALKQYGMDRHPVQENVRSESRMWLRTTGAEWLEVMGVDARLVIQRLAAAPCMEQGELEAQA